MRIDGREWILQRDGDPFPQPFAGQLSADGRTISGRWEKAEDGADFAVDFYSTYRKITPAEAGGPQPAAAAGDSS